MPRLDAPPGFRLRSTVRSHGWSDLPPFETDAAGDTLFICLPGSRAEVTQVGREIHVRLRGRRGRDVLDTVRACLHLDLDLSEFWELCRSDPALAWVPRVGAGRPLRAPTAFADAAMILSTTNCSWAFTRRIVAALTDRWGEGGAFPTRAAMARVSEAELRRAGLGYRAPFMAALARGPDLEPLRSDERPTPELRAWLLKLPGFGPYASESMLKLLGRFDYLALDSMVTRVWREKFPRRKPTQAAIERHLARYGRWRGLALWLLITAGWYERATWRI